MTIEEYKFGSITIDGKIYEYDVEVHWTGEVLKWWRGESHVIDIEDVNKAVEQNPELIIIGTGELGLVRATDKAKTEILSRGIGLIIDKTEEAVKTFNIQKGESEDFVLYRSEEGFRRWVFRTCLCHRYRCRKK